MQIFLEQPRGGSGEVLRVAISEFKSKRYVDTRIWFFDKGGELRPGRSGITLNREAMPGVIEALQAAAAALDDVQE